MAYLGDIMEDATDFDWVNAKASHGVMLCEMERGSLTWFDSERIDRLRCAHAQRNSAPNKQNWGRGSDSTRRPWYYRQFQLGLCTHQKDHKVGGRVHKHLWSYCLPQGRFLSHPEKDCHFVKKSQSTKNQLGAVQLYVSWAAVYKKYLMCQVISAFLKECMTMFLTLMYVTQMWRVIDLWHCLVIVSIVKRIVTV